MSDENRRRLRAMICGRPKTAKTGGTIVPLLEAGFEVGCINYDNNLDPVYSFASPEALTRFSGLVFQDRIRLGSGVSGGKKDFVQLADEPGAIRKTFSALDNWSKFDPDHQWGPVKTWGTNRVLVIDNLTDLGKASYDRICFINGRSAGYVRDSDWFAAMNDQDMMLAKLMSTEFGCHVICLAHLKLIGPKEPRVADAKDNEDLVDIKVAIAKANAEIVPTRYYPSALGRALPDNILHRVSTSVLTDINDQGDRVIITKPRPDIAFDIGVPGKVKREYPIETGILDIMEAVTGHRKPY